MTRNEILESIRRDKYREFLANHTFKHIKGPDLREDDQILAYRHGPSFGWEFWRRANSVMPHIPDFSKADKFSLSAYSDIEFLVVGSPTPEPGESDWGETAY